MLKKRLMERIVKSKFYNIGLILIMMIGIVMLIYKLFYNVVGGYFWESNLPMVSDTFTGYIVIIAIIIIGIGLKVRYDEKLKDLYFLVWAMWVIALIESLLHIL